jgi:hypothetical protein
MAAPAMDTAERVDDDQQWRASDKQKTDRWFFEFQI